ncbi:MAG: hypothetical protein AB7O52_18980 [Planctomycetota bacterium]
MNPMRLSILTLVSVSIFAIADVADAGSVFLKNGYIIQGKVVERSDDEIVLGWNNGQMTIHRRFIDEVILDPREEDELRQERPSPSSSAPNREPIVEQRVLVELPNKIEDIMPMRGFRPSDSRVTEVATAPDDPAPTERPDVTVTLPPMDLAPEVEFAAARLALAPPAGWRVEELEGVIRVQKSPDGQFPCLLVSYREQATIDAETAREQLLRAFEQDLPGVAILSEREQQIGFERALVLDGEVPDRVVFSEILLQRDGMCYLIGLQLPTPVEPQEQRALQACLHSLRFIR